MKENGFNSKGFKSKIEDIIDTVNDFFSEKENQLLNPLSIKDIELINKNLELKGLLYRSQNRKFSQLSLNYINKIIRAIPLIKSGQYNKTKICELTGLVSSSLRKIITYLNGPEIVLEISEQENSEIDEIIELLKGKFKISEIRENNKTLEKHIKNFLKKKIIFQGEITNSFRDYLIDEPNIKFKIKKYLLENGLISHENIDNRQRVKKYIMNFYQIHDKYPELNELYNSFIDIKSWTLINYRLENISDAEKKTIKENFPNDKKRCSRCKQILNINRFYFNKSLYHSSYCKKCHIEINSINIWKKKIQAIKYISKKEGYGNACKCFHCGIESLPLLEFHHTDLEKKEFSWIKLQKRSIYDIKPELDKCIILCRNCHLKVHAIFYYKHVDEILRNKIKDQQQNSIEEILPDNKRKCSKCHQILENNEFYLKKDKNRNKNLRHKICIECYKEMIQIRVWKKKKQAVNYVASKEKNNNYGNCLKCGIEDLPVLEFHHRDDYKENKEFGWSRLGKLTFKRIKEELDKCNIFCGNCHRNEHSKFYNKHEDEILSIVI